MIIIESAAVTLDSKVLLNIKEASDLFGIGQHRLREIVREDYGNKSFDAGENYQDQKKAI